LNSGFYTKFHEPTQNIKGVRDWVCHIEGIRMCEERYTRDIFRSKKEEVTGDWIKLYDEEVRDL